MSTYVFTESGDTPLPLLKELKENLLSSNPSHPLKHAKSYQIVPFQANGDGYADIVSTSQTMLKQLQPNVVYIGILAMQDKQQTLEANEMTGKCKVNENIFKGARKWETKYVIYAADDTEVGIYDSKTDCMREAKKYAMDNDCDVYVELEKRLTGSKSRVADISPQKRKTQRTVTVPDNRYVFFGKEA